MQIFTVDLNIPFLADILNRQTVRKNQKVANVFSSGEITNRQLIHSKTKFLIVRSTVRVVSDLLEGTDVEFVATATTGSEHIDIEYLKQKGIKFFAASGANSNSVAEYVIYSLLLWASKFQFTDLKNKKIGVIGFGNIGSKIAKYLDFMNINYLICDPFVEKNYNSNSNCNSKNITFCDIDFLINNCDVLTTHIPLTFDGEHPTHNLLNENRINKIKNNSLLIAASRGKICDEKAMLSRKNELQYVVDVWENEPIITNRELIDIALLATPHIAGHSFQGKLNATIMLVNKLNELYKMDLDLIDILEKTKLKNPFAQNEMLNYGALFEALSNSRKLLATSLEMKQQSKLNSKDFKQYFNTARLNYAEYYEILNFFTSN